MSESPVLEYWPEGIAAARIPANNNVRLLQALLINPAISATTAAQPGSPAEGDVYILPASPTGSNWALFFEDDVVIYYNATWTAYTPPEGLRKFVEDEGQDWQFVGDSSGGWAPAAGGGGIPDAPSDGDLYGRKDGAWEVVPPSVPAPLVTDATTALTADGSNAGNYTRFTNAGAKTYSFDDGETYSVGAEYHGRNAGAGDLTITEVGGFTVNPPTGGTLVIPEGGTFTVKIVASDEADLFGVTVAL